MASFNIFRSQPQAVPYRPAPAKPAPEQPAAQKTPQAPEQLARKLTKQLEVSGALAKLLQLSKAAEARESPAADFLAGASSFRMSESSEGGDAGALSLTKLHPKAVLPAKLQRAKRGSLEGVERITPRLGQAALDADCAAEIGEKAGLRAERKGAGVLGAVLARKLALGSGGSAAPAREPQALRKEPSLKPADLFLNRTGAGLRKPVILGAVPIAGGRPKEGLRTDVIGKKRLDEALRASGGRIGEFLRDSSVGPMLSAVAGIETALGTKLAARMKLETRAPVWG